MSAQTVTITREQLECWCGPLSDEQVPEALATIAASLSEEL